MFTLTISDKPIAVTNAEADEARELFMSEEFKEDLKALESEGAPLWDGFATLSVRPAEHKEALDARWKDIRDAHQRVALQGSTA